MPALKPFDSKTYRKNTLYGTSEGACCLCGRDTAGSDGGIHVPINHETGEFVTDAQAKEMGGAVSLYPIGPECVKRWAKAFPGTTRNRFRRSRGELISYDVKTV